MITSNIYSYPALFLILLFSLHIPYIFFNYCVVLGYSLLRFSSVFHFGKFLLTCFQDHWFFPKPFLGDLWAYQRQCSFLLQCTWFLEFPHDAVLGCPPVSSLYLTRLIITSSLSHYSPAACCSLISVRVLVTLIVVILIPYLIILKYVSLLCLSLQTICCWLFFLFFSFLFLFFVCECSKVPYNILLKVEHEAPSKRNWDKHLCCELLCFCG